MFNMAHMGVENFVPKSTVSVNIDSSSHPILPDGLRESSESKPANEIYREESEGSYQPFSTMFQATIGGEKRLSQCFRCCQIKKDKVGMFAA